jgi:crotonobetainyl-CoA:carnitine CoA-transferase CaiB-like acyl-CoA transferase
MSNSSLQTEGALANLKVVDLTRILAGPWSTQILADLGAEVVKIEQPGKGDDTRHWGPPWVKDKDGNDSKESAYFQCANRNKQSVCFDFTSDDDLARLKSLIAQADIVVENFKVGDTRKFGLDYDTVSKENPRLIYCSITGFGQTGPYAERPGYDLLIQAMGGLMSVTGEQDGIPGGGPQKVGVALSDIMTGLYATIGILAAVNERHRSGLGQHVDLALLDVTAAALANQATNYLVGNLVPGRMGNAHPNIVPYQSFATADSHLVIALGNDDQFERFVSLIGESWLTSDERFVSNEMRVKYRAELIPIIEQAMLNRKRNEWLDILEQHGIAAGPINTVKEVFEDPQVIARDMRVKLEQANGESVEVAGNPIKLSRTPVQYKSAPPLLGEHDH